MFKNGELVNCMICELCFKKIVKPNQFYCKKCQVKIRSNNILNSKVYKTKLNINSNSLVKFYNVSKEYIGK